MDGKCEHISAGGLGTRASTQTIAKARECRLKMERRRIVDLSTDAGSREVRPQAIARWGSNHELVIDVLGIRSKEDNVGTTGGRKRGTVGVGVNAAGSGRSRQMR